jgi:hypothetical protein
MQVRDRYPSHAVGGCCFVTKNAVLARGERVLDLDVDVDTMPAFGTLCVSETAVKLMADQLGYVVDAGMQAKLKAQRETIVALRAAETDLRAKLANIADAVGGAFVVPAEVPVTEGELA